MGCGASSGPKKPQEEPFTMSPEQYEASLPLHMQKGTQIIDRSSAVGYRRQKSGVIRDDHDYATPLHQTEKDHDKDVQKFKRRNSFTHNPLITSPDELEPDGRLAENAKIIPGELGKVTKNSTRLRKSRTMDISGEDHDKEFEIDYSAGTVLQPRNDSTDNPYALKNDRIRQETERARVAPHKLPSNEMSTKNSTKNLGIGKYKKQQSMPIP